MPFLIPNLFEFEKWKQILGKRIKSQYEQKILHWKVDKQAKESLNFKQKKLHSWMEAKFNIYSRSTITDFVHSSVKSKM